MYKRMNPYKEERGRMGNRRIMNMCLHQFLSCITYIKKAGSKVRIRTCSVLKDKYFHSLYPLKDNEEKYILLDIKKKYMLYTMNFNNMSV